VSLVTEPARRPQIDWGLVRATDPVAECAPSPTVARHQQKGSTPVSQGWLANRSLWRPPACIGSRSGMCSKSTSRCSLANAAHIRNVPGRKSADLLAHGLEGEAGCRSSKPSTG